MHIRDGAIVIEKGEKLPQRSMFVEPKPTTDTHSIEREIERMKTNFEA